MASVSDLEVPGAQPDIRELTLQGAVTERPGTLVGLATQSADPCPSGDPVLVGHAVDPELLDRTD